MASSNKTIVHSVTDSYCTGWHTCKTITAHWRVNITCRHTAGHAQIPLATYELNLHKVWPRKLCLCYTNKLYFSVKITAWKFREPVLYPVQSKQACLSDWTPRSTHDDEPLRMTSLITRTTHRCRRRPSQRGRFTAESQTNHCRRRPPDVDDAPLTAQS